MKSLRGMALLLAAAGALPAQEFTLGSAVSAFTLQDLNGSPVAFSGFPGSATVVMFISTQCPVSNDYNERIKQLWRDYSSRGVSFIAINANANEPAVEVRRHAAEFSFPFPVHKDAGNAVADRFGAQLTPETFVIDSAGVLRYHGFIDDSRNPARIRVNGLRDALEATLAGKPVAAPETKAFGCTVKRVPKTSLAPLDEAVYRSVVARHRGKVLLVDFWATWCTPCRARMPVLVELEEKYRRRGLRLATISADEPEKAADAARFLGQYNVRGPRYLMRTTDGTRFINSVDPGWSGAMPALFLYDRRGNKVAGLVGDTDMAAVEALLRKTL